MQPIFVTGIGTGIGKTVISAIITEALKADYWKPVQAGLSDTTDSLTVKELLSNPVSVVHPEAYKLSMPASPHIAAKQDNQLINLEKIERSFRHLSSINDNLVVEGPGGLMVPLNDNEFVVDLIAKLGARVVMVSRNYLGSINHSLLTAQLCRQRKLEVLGWIFNDEYGNYEEDIVKWSGYPMITRLPFSEQVDKGFVLKFAEMFEPVLKKIL